MDVESTANRLKEDFELTDFEALKIAVEMERNIIISNAFGVDDKGSTYLEGIARALGINRGEGIAGAIEHLATTKEY